MVDNHISTGRPCLPWDPSPSLVLTPIIQEKAGRTRGSLGDSIVEVVVL